MTTSWRHRSLGAVLMGLALGQPPGAAANLGRLLEPVSVRVDGAGTVLVGGASTANVFRISTSGVIDEIIDAAGDGAGNLLGAPCTPNCPTLNGNAIALAPNGDVIVAAFYVDRVFRVTPGGTVTLLVDAAGDGGSPLDFPGSVVVDGTGNVYVSGGLSDNVFKITPGGVITEVLDASGDGMGETLEGPSALAVDAADNVYVAGSLSDNVFAISSAGAVSVVMDQNGDGVNPLDGPGSLIASPGGDLLVGTYTDVFRVSGGVPAEIFTSSASVTSMAETTAGDVLLGTMEGVFLVEPDTTLTQLFTANPPFTGGFDVAADGVGNGYVSYVTTGEVHRVAPGGSTALILDAADFGGNQFSLDVAADAGGNAYVSIRRTVLADPVVVFRVEPDDSFERIIDAGGNACPTVPRLDCEPAPRRSLVHRSGVVQSVKMRPDTVPPAGYGDPLLADDYAFCFWEAGGVFLGGDVLEAGSTCGPRPCWQVLGTGGFRHVDPDRSYKLKLVAGEKPKVVWKARGKSTIDTENLLPRDPLPVLPVVYQVIGEHGECWDAAFTSGDVVSPPGPVLKAKVP